MSSAEERSNLVTGLAFALILTLALQLPSSAVSIETNLVDRPKQDLLPIRDIKDLSESDREVAEQLEIMPMLVELYDKENRPTLERAILLRRKIRETILESYLDAESVQAEAEREQGNLIATRQLLTTKVNRNVELNNATNFIGAGTLNTIGSALGFSAKEPVFPGNFLQMLSGVVAASMSSYALKQASGGKTKGEGQPTVLSELFGRPVDDRTRYPESVWRFFHGKSVETPGKTRAQFLEDRWISRRELERHGSHHEQLKVDLVCGVGTDAKVMSINDLTDQINMISDISATASLMTYHLRDLLQMIDSDVPLGIEP